jgi:hypothetical protein
MQTLGRGCKLTCIFWLKGEQQVSGSTNTSELQSRVVGRSPDLTYASPIHPPRGPEANEALLLAYPEERATLGDLLDEHPEVEALERQHPGLGESEYW